METKRHLGHPKPPIRVRPDHCTRVIQGENSALVGAAGKKFLSLQSSTIMLLLIIWDKKIDNTLGCHHTFVNSRKTFAPMHANVTKLIIKIMTKKLLKFVDLQKFDLLFANICQIWQFWQYTVHISMLHDSIP
jgi:hypothetical protein